MAQGLRWNRLMGRRRSGARAAPEAADGARELVATRYELLDKVGAGGVANVYRARDTRLNRTVALKILRDEYASDAEFVERFQREAHIAAGLSHPNVVSVDDYGRHGSTAFLVMHFVDGETLKARIRRLGRMAPDEAIGIARQVLAGLAAAHAQGLVHRDVKPHNVLLGWDGGVKLTDFGIALAAAAVGLTQTGTTVGTAAYAAPEQVTGKSVGPPADVYGVGLLLYEMITGRPPFGGGSVMELAWAHVNDEPRRPGDVVDGVPPALDALVMRALAKDPAARFADAATMLAAIDGRELSDAPPAAARPAGAPIAAAAAGAARAGLDATARLPEAPAAATAEGTAGVAVGEDGPGPATVGRTGAPLLVPAGLAGGVAGTTARLRQWVGGRRSRVVAVPALIGALALGGLIGAPRVIGSPPTPAPLVAPAPTAAVLTAQATPAPAAPEPTAVSTAVDRQLSEPFGLAPMDGPTPPAVGSGAATTQTGPPVPPARSGPPPARSGPAEAPAAGAGATSGSGDATTDTAPATAPTATAAPPPSPTSAPQPAQAGAPAPQPAKPAPSAPTPAPSPAAPTATPAVATTPTASGATPAATPGTPGPAATAVPAATPPATTPPATTPAATAAPPTATAAPQPTTAPTAPPQGGQPTPGRPPAASSPAPTAAPQPTTSTGG
jgi:tRNA A-37 threonylcarbamoyl transferase component Bud32